MRSFEEIKKEGKSIFLANYMPFVLVCLILAFVTGGLGSIRYNAGAENGATISVSYGPLSVQKPIIIMATAVLTALVVIVMIAMVIMFDIYVKNPFEYGCISWLRHQAHGDKEVNLTDIYRDEGFRRVVSTMFRRDAWCFLYFLLLIVPGIIKSYEYFFVPQLLEDHPELSGQEILDLSSRMTMGRKMEIFRFQLTFFGWWLLAAVTLQLTGIFYSNPYQYMSTQLLYEEYLEQDENVNTENTDSF